AGVDELAEQERDAQRDEEDVDERAGELPQEDDPRARRLRLGKLVESMAPESPRRLLLGQPLGSRAEASRHLLGLERMPRVGLLLPLHVAPSTATRGSNHAGPRRPSPACRARRKPLRRRIPRPRPGASAPPRRHGSGRSTSRESARESRAVAPSAAPFGRGGRPPGPRRRSRPWRDRWGRRGSAAGSRQNLAAAPAPPAT